MVAPSMALALALAAWATGKSLVPVMTSVRLSLLLMPLASVTVKGTCRVSVWSLARYW